MGGALTLEEAISKSKIELKKRGYDIDNFHVIADEKNTKWKEYIETFPSVMESKNVKEMNLKEKSYWAIYFEPTELILGGDVWVFVNINDGSIISILFGK